MNKYSHLENLTKLSNLSISNPRIRGSRSWRTKIASVPKHAFFMIIFFLHHMISNFLFFYFQFSSRSRDLVVMFNMVVLL